MAKVNEIAIHQMKLLTKDMHMKQIEEKSEK